MFSKLQNKIINSPSVLYNNKTGDILSIGEEKDVKQFYDNYYETLIFLLGSATKEEHNKILILISNLEFTILKNFNSEVYDNMVSTRSIRDLFAMNTD